MRDVRDVDRQLLLDDTAGLTHACPSMPLRDVHPLHDEPPVLGKDTQHLAGPALVAAADDDDIVALLDLQLRHLPAPRRAPQRTSGASDTIFMNRRARNSRVTGPKMRVPIGSP